MSIERSLEEVFSVLRQKGESRYLEYDFQFLAVSLCCCSSKKITALKKKYIYQKLNKSQMTCSGTIKSGPNKGQKCRLAATEGNYCKTHAKTKSEESDNDSDDKQDDRKENKKKQLASKLKTKKKKKHLSSDSDSSSDDSSNSSSDSSSDSDTEKMRKLKKKLRKLKKKKKQVSSDSDSSDSDSESKREKIKKKKKVQVKKKKQQSDSESSSSDSENDEKEKKVDEVVERNSDVVHEDQKINQETKVETVVKERKIRPIQDDDLVIRPNRFRNFLYPGTNLVIDVKDKKVVASEGLDGRWIALERCDIDKCKQLKIKYKIIDLEFRGQK